MSSDPVPGIISTADHTRPGAIYLPLESVKVHAYIADLNARVVLSQLYHNDTQNILKEAHYVFPVPARATVCGFDMRTDGRRLKGIVKEISEAKMDYQNAINQGRLAGLLQQFRQDGEVLDISCIMDPCCSTMLDSFSVFAICIGTIPRDKDVTITLSYVIDLSEDDQHDTVRFFLPLHVGARYGAPPTSVLSRGTAHIARVSITVNIDMAAEISNVYSPSHSHIEVIRSIADRRRQCVKWQSMEELMDKDFVLVIQASGLDMSRCVAETLSPSENLVANPNSGPTTALALTIVPQFGIPTLATQEYLFLVDRSGSMSGIKIKIAKKTLNFLLRRLPSLGTTFNIFSFGDSCISLWPQSQQYTNDNLETATSHVNTMGADLGHTEIMSALGGTFAMRSSEVPTSVFVLTDGWVYNPPSVIDSVRRTVGSAPISSPLRVFTLGVGDASTELCEGLAKAGNGACLMTLEAEDLILKSARIVDAMRASTVEALTVDWGVPSHQVLQSPSKIGNISPGVRQVVTAIIPNNGPPPNVILRGRLSDGSNLNYDVTVTHAHVARRRAECPPLIHTLAAHRFIGDLDIYNDKDLMVDLATRYQVASEHTAFVAVDAPSNPRRPNPPVQQQPPNTGGGDDGNNTGGGGDGGNNTGGSGGGSGGGNNTGGSGGGGGGGGGNNTGGGDGDGNNTGGGDGDGNNTGGGGGGGGDGNNTGGGGGSGNNADVGTSPPSQHSMNGADISPPPSDNTGYQTADEEQMDAQAQTQNSVASSSSPRGGVIYVQNPPAGSAGEVLSLPDPHKSKGIMMFIAPPLPHIPVLNWLPGRAFWSTVIKKSTQLAMTGLSYFNTYRQTSWNEDVASTEELLGFSVLQAADGGFTLSQKLISAVHISDEKNRALPPNLPSTHIGERVWATAIAVAFFRSKFPRLSELWKPLQEKAAIFVSQSLPGDDTFENIVAEASQLFSP